MKNIANKLITLFKSGYCTPQISKIAKKIKEPSTTIHYNIKKLEKDGIIKAYKAVFDYKKIDQGVCNYVLISLAPSQYGDPEEVANSLAKHLEVESVDICTGDWEIILKVRAKDQEEYYNFVKNVISKKNVFKIKSLTSMKQIKTEHVLV
jgi:DNA-binding Lrp family transcriptional regulator